MSGTILFAGGRSRVLVTGEETGGGWALLDNEHPPGNATPPHLHQRDVEVPFVLSGELTVETGGRRRILKAGDAAMLPRARPHRISNAGPAQVRYLLFCVPAGFERFMMAVGAPAARDDEPARAMTEVDRRRLAEIAPSYGIELLDAAALEASPASLASEGATDFGSVIGIRIEMLAETGLAEAGFALLRVTLPPGSTIPLHAHDEPESFVVLAGCLDVHIDGAWHRLAAGQHAFVPSGARHAIRNAGSEPTIALCATRPSLARFFRDAAEPAGLRPSGPPTPEQIERLLATAAAHGQTIYGPAEQAAAGILIGPA